MEHINSFAYLAQQYRMIHAGRDRYRGKVLPYLGSIVADCVNRHNANRLLDYGCGQGLQYLEDKAHHRWGDAIPYLYDPGVEEFAVKPIGTFDGVLCFDVAEHIPENYIHWFLKDVLSYADKFAVFCIFTEPAKAKLPDGRNAHLTVQPQTWWEEKITNTLEERAFTVDMVKPWHVKFIRDDIEVHTVFRCKANKNLDQ